MPAGEIPPAFFLHFPSILQKTNPGHGTAMTAIELSSYAGLAAMTLLTLNILLGLVMSVKHNPVRDWPHRRINTFKIHNWTAYLALSVAVLHPLILTFSSTAKFTLIDILYPVNDQTTPSRATKSPGVVTSDLRSQPLRSRILFSRSRQ
jgi:predicted ferric reductase